MKLMNSYYEFNHELIELTESIVQSYCNLKYKMNSIKGKNKINIDSLLLSSRSAMWAQILKSHLDRQQSWSSWLKCSQRDSEIQKVLFRNLRKTVNVKFEIEVSFSGFSSSSSSLKIKTWKTSSITSCDVFIRLRQHWKLRKLIIFIKPIQEHQLYIVSIWKRSKRLR